jgi:hypothetical protein
VHAAESRSLTTLGARDEGAITIVVALLLVVCVGMGALVLDLGNARQSLRAAQAGADAAALAAGRDLLSVPTWLTVIADVQAYASANFQSTVLDWTGCVDPLALAYQPDIGNLDSCISADSQASPTQIRVKLPIRKMQTSFAQVLGKSSLGISAAASARVVTGAPCALCVLDPTVSGAFSANGNGSVVVTGAAVVVNSTSSSASSLIGNATVQATAIGGPAAPGGFSTSGNATYTPTPVPMAPVPDPLAFLKQCPAAGTPSPCPTLTMPDVWVTGNSSQAIVPGIYGSIGVSGNGSLTMAPGTYVITNSLSFSGNGSLTANGVTMYFACSSYPTPCSSGQSGASYSITGNGSVNITPPATGPFQGLSIFGDRNNKASVSLSGNGNLLSGTVYMKSAALSLSGNGSLTLNSLIVVDTCTVSGNGSVNLSYSKTQNVTINAVQLSG